MNSVFLPNKSAGEGPFVPLTKEKVLRPTFNDSLPKNKERKPRFLIPPVPSTSPVSLGPGFSEVRSGLLRVRNS